MRIVHVVFAFCTGGLETMLVDIMREQVRADDVHLVVVNDLYDKPLLDSIDFRVKLHCIGRKPGSRNPFPILKLNLLLARLRPDVIHIHQASLARWLFVRSRPVLTIHDLHIVLPPKARDCKMIAISEAVAEDIRSRYEDVEITVIPNGIDVESIRRRADVACGRPVRLVQVARFDIEKKGQDILVEAVALLKKAGYDTDLTLIGGADFDRIPEIEAQAREAGVSDRLHIVRGLTRPELYNALKDFDIMVHPARYEGFGLVIAEGMAAGLPVAVPAFGGPYEVAGNGRYAEVFAPDSPKGCAAAISRIIDNYAEAMMRAGDGVAHVARRYSLRRLVANYRELYLK